MRRPRFGMALAIAIGFADPGTWAREVGYDFVVCSHARHSMLEANADIVAFGFEQWGVVSTSTSREWDKATTRCVGSLRIVAGKPVGKGLCKWFTAAGDTALGEWEYPAAGEPSWTWLAGSGGLKGIAGRGQFSALGSGVAAQADTSQSCRRDWGRYTLP